MSGSIPQTGERQERTLRYGTGSRATECNGGRFLRLGGWGGVRILLVEASAHAVPFVRDRLDTLDPQFLGEKLAVLALGATVYTGLTLGTLKRAVQSFERLDL